MKTKKQTAKPAAEKSTKPSTKAPKDKKEIPAEVLAKMTKWNEQHPEMKFSWVVIGPNTPAGQQTCRVCKKGFREGRVTRVDASGAAFCGPQCQRKAQSSKK